MFESIMSMCNAPDFFKFARPYSRTPYAPLELRYELFNLQRRFQDYLSPSNLYEYALISLQAKLFP